MFENKKPKGWNWNYSRFIASYAREGGDPTSPEFKDWLRHLGLEENDVILCHNLAWCGSAELEADARRWFAQKNGGVA